MSALALACGNNGELSALSDHEIEVRAAPSRPGRAEVDPLLSRLGDRRLVVMGTDADLAAVVLRLLRTDRLADVVIGFVPTGTDAAGTHSEVATLWRLPRDPDSAIVRALTGDVEPIPLIRDDAGGILLGLGTIGPVRGVGYCDDATALRGRASRIEVSPDHERGAGLVVRVVQRGLLGRRSSTLHGRAFQVGCLPVRPVSDGRVHPRPMTRWTWYRHTQDLRAVRGGL